MHCELASSDGFAVAGGAFHCSHQKVVDIGSRFSELRRGAGVTALTDGGGHGSVWIFTAATGVSWKDTYKNESEGPVSMNSLSCLCYST